MSSVPGESLDFQGPRGHIAYQGNGDFLIRPKEDERAPPVRRHFRRLGLLVGGSGISTMLHLTKTVLRQPDGPAIWLLIADKTEQDILLRQ